MLQTLSDAERNAHQGASVLLMDAGVTGTGYACLTGCGIIALSGVIRGSAAVDWLTRCSLICKEFQTVLEDFRPFHVVIEVPELWTGSAKSQMSAGSGDLFKQSILIGSLFGFVWRQHARAWAITAQQWKGQLSKDAVMRRIYRRLPDLERKGLRDHEADAIGMALWWVYNGRW